MNYTVDGNIIKLQMSPRSIRDEAATDKAIRTRYQIKQEVNEKEGLILLEGPIIENLFMYAKDRLKATKASCSTRTWTLSFLKLPIRFTKFNSHEPGH